MSRKRVSRLWTLLVMGGAMCVGLSGASPAQTTPPAAAGAVELEAEPKKDAKSGISIRLPKGWVPKQGITNTGFEAPAKDRNEIGGLAPSVVLSREAAPGIKPPDLKAAIEQKRKQYATLFEGFKETKVEMIKIGGKDAGVIGFTFDVQKVLKVRQRQVWFVGEGQVYTVTFATLDSAAAKNEPAFDAMMATIQVP